MKITERLKHNDVVTIYNNYQTCEIPIGEVELIKKIRDGETFIIDDDVSENQLLTYAYELWLVKVLKSDILIEGELYTRKIRYLYSDSYVTRQNSKTKAEQSTIIDEFLKINGKEIY